MSPIYGLAMQIREKLYQNGFLRQHSLPVPIISVGNLVIGGTGKTPTVCYLAKHLLRHGYHPAIISRGYKGKARCKTNVVSDGKDTLLTPEQAGDEPFMLAEALPGVPVLTGTRRIHPCRDAVDKYHADVLILDDGFQHLSVRRNIDIVLFDATDLAGNNRVFPGGRLREPLSALSRCDVFLLTGISAKNRQSAIKFSKYLQQLLPSRPVYFASHGPLKVQCPDDLPGSNARDGSFFAFCGIANPSRFKDTLEILQIQQRGFLAFPDHVQYNQEIMHDICKKALVVGATRLITTQKDFVKLKYLQSSLPRYVVELDFQIDTGFELLIIDRLQNLSQSKGLLPVVT